MRPEVVDLARLHLAQEVDERDRVRQIPVMQEQTPIGFMRILIDGIDIRDFDVPFPAVLMLKILPDVRVRMSLEAERED